MEQELGFIETFNRAIARGVINDPNFRTIRISRILLDRNLPSRSKLDRRPELLANLRQYGQTKSRGFLKDRSSLTEGKLASGAGS